MSGLILLFIFTIQGYAHRYLLLENIALRHQLLVYKRTIRRPALNNRDRLLWILLSRIWNGWQEHVALWQPATVLKWRRNILRLVWKWKSRGGRPKIPIEEIRLIQRLAKDNSAWGPHEIQREMIALGFPERHPDTIAAYMPKRRPRNPGGPSWQTFLNLHRERIAAMDFFVVYLWNFVPVYVFFVIGHGRRNVLHVNVTRYPTFAWVKQQLREAFPGDHESRFLVHDNEPAFKACRRFMETCLDILPRRTALCSPWQNGIAERFVKTARNMCTDHIIPLSERHLLKVMREFAQYYNEDRGHSANAGDSPAGRAVTPRPSPSAKIVAIPRVRGLHHRYEWREVA